MEKGGRRIASAGKEFALLLLIFTSFCSARWEKCVWNERWKLSILVKDLSSSACLSAMLLLSFAQLFFAHLLSFFSLFPPQTSLFHPPNYFFHPLLRTLSLPPHGNFDYLAPSSSDEKPWKGGGPTSCMTRKTGEGRKCRDTPVLTGGRR